MVWQTHRNASAIYSFYGDEPVLAGSGRETAGRSSPSRYISLTDTRTVLRDRDSGHVQFLLFKWFRNERVVEDQKLSCYGRREEERRVGRRCVILQRVCVLEYLQNLEVLSARLHVFPGCTTSFPQSRVAYNLPYLLCHQLKLKLFLGYNLKELEAENQSNPKEAEIQK